MNLTPLDIRRQQFAKAFRGYEPTEVDTFLKQVSDQLETMLDEVRHANERVREAEAKLAHYEKVELALQEALESARETARQAQAAAEARAKLIVEEAELKAERLVHEAERERYGLRQDLAKLNSRQAEVAARLRGFLLSELEVLAQFQGDEPIGFIKLQSAEASGGTLPPPRPAQLVAGTEPGGEAPEEAGGETPPADAPAPAEAPDRKEAAPEAEAPEAAAEPEPWTTPPVEPPTAEPSTTGDASPPDAEAPSEASAEAAPDEEAGTVPEPDEAPPNETAPAPPAVTGGWDLRSLVTGGERSVAASEAERERIRRILDDLD